MKSTILLLIASLFIAPTVFARSSQRVKVFKSQKGLPLKAVRHEIVLTNAGVIGATGGSAAGLFLSDGDTTINVVANYRYSLNRKLQIEGRLGILSSDALDVTQFGGGAIYNFQGRKLGNQFFAGGGLILQSGDVDDTVVYGIGGKRFAISRHMSFSPYVQLDFPSDSDRDSVISIIPFSISALF